MATPSTGLSQDVQSLALTPEPLHTTPTNTPSNTPAALTALDIQQGFQELLEQEILEFSEIIQARAATSQHYSPPRLEKVQQSDDNHRAQELLLFLQALGYEPNNENPFTAMGFAELDGPELTSTLLNRRLQFADTHIKHYTTPGAQHSCDLLLQRITLAHERCLTLLPDIRNKRKLLKGMTKQTDHWRELHKDGITYLIGIIPKDTSGRAILATQLSNVLRQDLTEFAQLASVADTRDLFGKLNSPTSVLETTLRSTSSHITTWAPHVNSQVLKLAAAYREALAKGQGPQSLTLLFPMDHYPGCTDPAFITDIWGHPLLGNKFADLVQDTRFLQPPMRMIVPGRHTPVHANKCLAMISLGPRGPTGAIPARITTEHENLFTIRYYSTIWIDIPYAHRWHVYGLLDTFKLPGHEHTDRPRPSLGHRAEDPRSTIKVHFNQNVGSELMQKVVIGWLCKVLHTYQPLIGRQATITEPTAHMLDITKPSGAFLASHLCNDCIIMSQRLAIVSTNSSPEAWTHNMTQAWHQDPNTCALSLRMRDSSSARDKRVAEVAVTKEQMSAVRARKGHETISPSIDKPLTLRATIELPIRVDGGSRTWLPHLMSHIGTVTGVTLGQHLGETGLDLGTWKSIDNFEGNWTGKVLVQCKTASDLLSLYKIIQGKGINIQGHMANVNMHSDYVDLARHSTESC